MFDVMVAPAMRRTLLFPDLWTLWTRMAIEMHAEFVGRIAYMVFPPFFQAGYRPRTFESLRIGESAELTVRITHASLLYFGRASGDFNPAHFSYLEALGTLFGEPIAHGLLVASYLSALLAGELPGPGTIYRAQTLEFKAPAYIGDVLVARVTITALEPERKRVTLACEVKNEDGKELIMGEAVVVLPRPKPR